MKTPQERGVKCKALLPDGKCVGYVRGKCKFNPEHTKEWFEETFEMIDPGEICGKMSVFENHFISITQDQLDALKAGKVLYLEGEYRIFVAQRKTHEDDK